MKALAIYLPAFHQCKENDEWWGKGFTEWDNVKTAKAYYKGHIQPVQPINNEYYDLAKKEDIEKQSILAQKYGIYGFIFYHYWFGNDKQIFQNPVEIFKNDKDIKTNYCFCWANDTWVTTWHGKEAKELLRQTYGGKEEWEKHIRYLIEHFKSEKYIKIDNRPVLFIYKPHEIENYEEMIDYWNRVLEKEGLNKIYIIEYISSKNKKLSSDKSDAVTEFEPLYTTFFDISIFNKAKRFLCKKFKTIDFQNYDILWKKIINRRRTYNDKTIYKGCFVGWDNSPRKEKNSMIVKGGAPEKFSKYFKMLVKKERKNASEEYVVINAWNEWSEGAMLEPSEQYKYKYLEGVKEALDE